MGARLFKGNVAGQLGDGLVHVKVEELCVGKQSEIVVEVGKVLWCSGVCGGGDCVEVGDVLRHVRCPTAIIAGHVRWAGSPTRRR